MGTTYRMTACATWRTKGARDVKLALWTLGAVAFWGVIYASVWAVNRLVLGAGALAKWVFGQ